ncbi:MAG: sporulation protein YunB [Bacillota bacterium]
MRRRRKGNKLLLILILIAFFIFGSFGYLEFSLRPTILAFSETQARWTATEAIHQAILEEIAADVTYNDLIIVEKNSKDEVVFMQANMVKVMSLASKATLRIQGVLKNLQYNSFNIPLGQVMGSRLLAAYGPGIKIELVPLGTVRINVKDSFESAGINQTRHRIILDVTCNVKVIIPFINSDVEVITQVPVAEAIIVGAVPSTYVTMGVNPTTLFSGKTGN